MTRRKDNDQIGALAGLAARWRAGRDHGLGPLAAARFFEPVVREALALLPVRSDDNVALLGALDARPISSLLPRCRELTVVDDIDERRLQALEADWRGRGHPNIRFQWGFPSRLATPQGSIDRLLGVNFAFRGRDPRETFRQTIFTSTHGATVVVCEPAASLDGRTARKYSREAQLSMEEHRALLAYARAADAFRGFTREGIASIMSGVGLKDVTVHELLHGLVVAARGTVEL